MIGVCQESQHFELVDRKDEIDILPGGKCWLGMSVWVTSLGYDDDGAQGVQGVRAWRNGRIMMRISENWRCDLHRAARWLNTRLSFCLGRGQIHERTRDSDGDLKGGWEGTCSALGRINQIAKYGQSRTLRATTQRLSLEAARLRPRWGYVSAKPAGRVSFLACHRPITSRLPQASTFTHSMLYQTAIMMIMMATSHPWLDACINASLVRSPCSETAGNQDK